MLGAIPPYAVVARGDETLDAMSTDDTPGQRTSVTRYDVAIRMAV